MPYLKHSPSQFLELVQSNEFYITSDQIKALNTTAVVVLPGESGFFHVPVKAHIHREAGTAYTANGATAIQIRQTTNPSVVQLTTFDLGILTSAGPFTVVCSGPSTAAGTQLSGAEPSTRNVGDSFEIFAAGGNPTIGTGGLYVTIWYNKFKHGRL